MPPDFDATMSNDLSSVVQVQDLVLTYGSRVRALDNLSVAIAPGCHGILGPNGAGKSTLIKVLLGLLPPDSGTGSVLGRSIHSDREELRRRVGYMPERDAHVPGMTAIDYVSMMGELSGMQRAPATKRAHEVLHYVDLGEARYRPVDGYSAGMRQRLKLAGAIVHDPDLLFLDEPTNGLDPQGRRYMLELIAELGREEISVLVSTHLLPDVQEICESVVVVSAGRVTRQGTVAELTQGLDRSFRLSVVGDVPPFLSALERRDVEANFEPTTGELMVRVPESGGPRTLLEAARETGVGLKQMVPAARTLEEVFMESIGEAQHGDS